MKTPTYEVKLNEVIIDVPIKLMNYTREQLPIPNYDVEFEDENGNRYKGIFFTDNEMEFIDSHGNIMPSGFMADVVVHNEDAWLIMDTDEIVKWEYVAEIY